MATLQNKGRVRFTVTAITTANVSSNILAVMKNSLTCVSMAVPRLNSSSFRSNFDMTHDISNCVGTLGTGNAVTVSNNTILRALLRYNAEIK